MSSNSCWSTTVQSGVPCKVTFPAGAILNITGLSLDIDPKKLSTVSGKITLAISVNNAKPVTIMNFIVGRYDSAVVNILLGKNDSAVLTSTGANFPVHVSGCLVSYKPGQKPPASVASKNSASAVKNQPTTKKTLTPAPKSVPSAAKKPPASKNPTVASKNPTTAAKKSPESSAAKKTVAASNVKKTAAKHAPQKK